MKVNYHNRPDSASGPRSPEPEGSDTRSRKNGRAPQRTETTNPSVAVHVAQGAVKAFRALLTVLCTLSIGLLGICGEAVVYLGQRVIDATGGGRALTKKTTGLRHVVLHTLLLAAFAYSVYQWYGLTGGWFDDNNRAQQLAVLVAFLFSSATGIVQARFLRYDHVAMRGAKLQEVLQNRIDPAQVAGMIDVAKKRAADYNRAHLRSYWLDGMLALGAWCAEYHALTHNVIWPDPMLSIDGAKVLAIALLSLFSVEAVIHVIEGDELP